MVDPMSPLDLDMDFDTLAALRKKSNLRQVSKNEHKELVSNDYNDDI